MESAGPAGSAGSGALKTMVSRGASGGAAVGVPSTRAPAVADAVLRQLGPVPPDAGGDEAQRALAEAYAAFTAAAERRAFG